MSRLYGQHPVEAHPRGTSPHDHVAVFQKDAPRGIGPLKSAEQENALESQRHRDNGRKQIKIGAVLVDAELCPRLIPVDVAGN